MAVFTPVSEAELNAWLDAYDVGQVVELQGILTGIDNSNFFVTTSGQADAGPQRYVLTLFENLSADDLPFNLGLMANLADQGVPAPRPIPDRSGAILGALNGKPAALVTRLTGSDHEVPTAPMCDAVGRMLAHMHQLAGNFSQHRDNPLGDAWMIRASAAVAPYLSNEQRALLAAEVTLQTTHDRSSLPSGPIHADLFRDNVLWQGDSLSGVIDFYFACTDCLLFDLAVTASDWCCVDGTVDRELLAALVTAYRASRPLTPAEEQAWPILLRRAALRFWLSRLFDLHLPRPASLNKPKDPGHFERILRSVIAQPVALF